jgi:hypothetical protein
MLVILLLLLLLLLRFFTIAAIFQAQFNHYSNSHFYQDIRVLERQLSFVLVTCHPLHTSAQRNKTSIKILPSQSKIFQLISIDWHRCALIKITKGINCQCPACNLNSITTIHATFLQFPNLSLSATWKQGTVLCVGKRPYNLWHTHTQQNVILCSKLYFVLLKT